ncbi:EamA family transporter [Kitasatospora camelliae]|uniref:EamA family transporter n=1 Tax=Kitasatospora camelliae TaxID=3156397 RepID=A0AAU8K3G3_9ACTN
MAPPSRPATTPPSAPSPATPATPAVPPAPARPRAAGEALGLIALAVTVAIWAGFALSARALAGSTLLPADAGLIRFGLPVLLLAPALWRRRRQLTAVPAATALKILCGAGVPFFLAAMAGGKLTSAAFVGALIPGTVPLFVSALMAAKGHGAPRGLQRFGLAAITLGAVTLVSPHLLPVDGGTLAGSGLLLLAGGLWALYTVGLRETTLDPVGSIGLLCIPSFAVLALLAATGVLPTNLVHAAPGDLLLFVLLQGLGVGLCAGLLYAFAIRRLGAERCAVAGSLSPVAAALLAVPLLGERPGTAVLLGVPVITAGVILANRRPAAKPTAAAAPGAAGAATDAAQDPAAATARPEPKVPADA